MQETYAANYQSLVQGGVPVQETVAARAQQARKWGFEGVHLNASAHRLYMPHSPVAVATSCCFRVWCRCMAPRWLSREVAISRDGYLCPLIVPPSVASVRSTCLPTLVFGCSSGPTAADDAAAATCSDCCLRGRPLLCQGTAEERAAAHAHGAVRVDIQCPITLEVVR